MSFVVSPSDRRRETPISVAPGSRFTGSQANHGVSVFGTDLSEELAELGPRVRRGRRARPSASTGRDSRRRLVVRLVSGGQVLQRDSVLHPKT